MAALADFSKSWHIVLRCTICGPLGLLFSNPFHYNIFMNCMQHDYCDEINMFKLTNYFYGTFSRKLLKYPIFAFQCSFLCLRDHYFDKNELNVTLQM